jgi:hypothetical protein
MEVVVGYLWHYPGGTEKNFENSQSGYSVPGLRLAGLESKSYSVRSSALEIWMSEAFMRDFTNHHHYYYHWQPAASSKATANLLSGKHWTRTQWPDSCLTSQLATRFTGRQSNSCTSWMTSQGWRTFLSARAQIVVHFRRRYFECHGNIWQQNEVLEYCIIIIIIIIIIIL